MIAVTQAGVVRSEWIKLRSLRSTVLTLLLAAASMGLFALIGATNAARDFELGTAAGRAAVQPAQALLSGWFMAQIVVGIVGVLAVSSEYASGSMAATLLAAPRRLPVLVAKVLVAPAVAALVMVPATVAGFLAGRLLLPDALPVSLTDSGVPRAILGVALAMAAVCAMGAALGFVVRSTAAGIGILVVVLLVVPGMVAGTAKGLHQWLPAGALESLVTVNRSREELPLLAWPAGLALTAAWVAASVCAAWVVLRRRDA